MLAGASIFSGQIAYHTIFDDATFQMLTPIGGTLMMLSWLIVTVLAIVGMVRKG